MLDNYIKKAQDFLKNPTEEYVITIDDLRDSLDKENNLFLLDVRMPEEVAEGRIEGVVNIPLPEIEKRIAEIPKDKEIITICARGGRASAAMFLLNDKGYNQVKVLIGGTLGWIHEGNKVV